MKIQNTACLNETTGLFFPEITLFINLPALFLISDHEPQGRAQFAAPSTHVIAPDCAWPQNTQGTGVLGLV